MQNLTEKTGDLAQSRINQEIKYIALYLGFSDVLEMEKWRSGEVGNREKCGGLLMSPYGLGKFPLD